MFFTQINQMMAQGVDITLVIRKKEGQLVVSAMPKSNGLKDEAQHHIVPLTVTGTPEELDRGFIPTICRPLQKAAGLLANMNQFEQQADKAAANSKAAKELKDKEAKAAKDKKEKFEKHMKSATDLESEKKYPEALASLQQAKKFAIPQDMKSVDEKIKAVKSKLGQVDLFDMDPPVQQQHPEEPPQISTGRQNGQQLPSNGQPVQHPMDGNAVQNGQRPMQQSLYGNGQPLYQQTACQQPRAGQPQYGNQPYNGQGPTDIFQDTEPQTITTNDPTAHREGEYDQYPDFPGYTDNRMYNYQNM